MDLSSHALHSGHPSSSSNKEDRRTAVHSSSKWSQLGCYGTGDASARMAAGALATSKARTFVEGVEPHLISHCVKHGFRASGGCSNRSSASQRRLTAPCRQQASTSGASHTAQMAKPVAGLDDAGQQAAKLQKARDTCAQQLGGDHEVSKKVEADLQAQRQKLCSSKPLLVQLQSTQSRLQRVEAQVLKTDDLDEQLGSFGASRLQAFRCTPPFAAGAAVIAGSGYQSPLPPLTDAATKVSEERVHSAAQTFRSRLERVAAATYTRPRRLAARDRLCTPHSLWSPPSSARHGAVFRASSPASSQRACSRT